MTTPLMMASSNGGGLFLFIIFGVIAMIVAISISTARTSRLRAALEQMARRLNGRVSEGGWMGEPTIEFTLIGRAAKMEFYAGGKNSSPYSRVIVGLGGRSPGTLHIMPEGFGQSFLKLFGAQDLLVGDARFDSDYVVKASPESLVLQIFSPARRDQLIASIRRLSWGSDATIDLDRNQLTVRVREFITSDSRLMLMVRTAEEFLKSLISAEPLPAVAGIQLGDVKVSSGGDCPVCSTVMGDRLVRCEACQTPHHAECWAYMGRCSTYACTGKRAA